jgi:SOS-response transcriptional repressor LexA
MSARDDRRPARPKTDAVDTSTPVARETGGSQPPDVAAQDAARQIEREKDILVQLVGAWAVMEMDFDNPRNFRFLDWLERDLRERQTPAERVEQGLRADAFARRMVARMRARGTLKVTMVTGIPSARPALVEGSVLRVARAAAEQRCAPLMDLSVAAGIGRELWDEPCEQWIALPDDVPDGSYVGLTVAGDSMQPLLHEGDVILVQIGSDVYEDTIVVARHPEDGYVVKRVAHVADDEIELTSLNPAFGPLQIPHDAALIVGTVVMTWCNHGQPSRPKRS